MQAVRLFRSKKPIVGAIHGAAVGGGLGLAMVPDFRVACPETRFCANFTRLGFHPGFGLTDHAARGDRQDQRRDDVLHQPPRHRRGGARDGPRRRAGAAGSGARGRAKARRRDRRERAARARLATRATMRAGLADRVKAATEHELEEQTRLRQTEDFKEGVKAMAERRVPNFAGRWRTALSAIPAKAGIHESQPWALGPRLRGDERIVRLRLLDQIRHAFRHHDGRRCSCWRRGSTASPRRRTRASHATPRTRPCGVVTASGSSSRPMRQLPTGCHTPATALLQIGVERRVVGEHIGERHAAGHQRVDHPGAQHRAARRASRRARPSGSRCACPAPRRRARGPNSWSERSLMRMPSSSGAAAISATKRNALRSRSRSRRSESMRKSTSGSSRGSAERSVTEPLRIGLVDPEIERADAPAERVPARARQ